MIMWKPVIIDVRAITSTSRRKARSADDDVFSLRTEDTAPVLISFCPVTDSSFSEAVTGSLCFISVLLFPVVILTAFFVAHRFETDFFEAFLFKTAVSGLDPFSGKSMQSAAAL